MSVTAEPELFPLQVTHTQKTTTTYLLSRNAGKAVVQAVLIPEEIGPQSSRHTSTERFPAGRGRQNRRKKKTHGYNGNPQRAADTRGMGKQRIGGWR